MQGVENLRPFLFPAISSITIMNTEPEAKTNEYLRGIVANLPEKPGVYQYLNTEGTIIYVGKAKNLKKGIFLLQQRAWTRQDTSIGQQDCRYPLHRC